MLKRAVYFGARDNTALELCLASNFLANPVRRAELLATGRTLDSVKIHTLDLIWFDCAALGGHVLSSEAGKPWPHKLTPEQRKASARKAGQARWAKKKEKEMIHEL